jgi:predicted phage terminase large subunit-like protein
VWDGDTRFAVLAAGRRFGKSRLGALRCVYGALQGRRSWWIWPTYANGSIGWRMLKQLALQIPGAEVREVERMVTLPTGGWAQIKSADKPDSLRGEGLDDAIVDEAAHIRKFNEVWEQALRPALSDRQGRALFISTPKGHNDFHELYKRGESGSDEWASFRFPTRANPFINKDEIAAAKADLPALVFRQEYLAEFVQLAGALFRREWFNNVVDVAPPVRAWVRFWDLAASTKTTADFTAGGKVGLTEDGTLVIGDMVRGRWEWPQALKIISSTARSDGSAVRQGIEDVGVQKGMYQMLAAEPALAGIAFQPVRVQRDKITRASPWLARAEQGKVILVRGAWNGPFLDEVCAFPETTHDDQVDAISGGVGMLAGAQSRPVNLAQALAQRRRR